MIDGLRCKLCNSYNDILRIHCNNCQIYIDSPVSGLQYSWIKIKRSGEFYPMDHERAELHAQFFNGHRLLIREMSDDELNKQRKQLEDICFEARAKLNATDQELRERKQKKNPSAREWMISPDGPDISVTDAINAPKLRKKRMTKADQLMETFQKLGIDAKTAASLIGKGMKQATDEKVNEIKFNDKGALERKAELRSAEQEAKAAEPDFDFGTFNLGE